VVWIQGCLSGNPQRKGLFAKVFATLMTRLGKRQNVLKLWKTLWKLETAFFTAAFAKTGQNRSADAFASSK
jgi:hypothetical protein